MTGGEFDSSGVERDLDIRWLEPETSPYLAALRVILGAPRFSDPQQPNSALSDLLARAQRGTIRLSPIPAAFLGSQMVGAAVAIEDCGSAGLAMFPTVLQPTPRYAGTVVALRVLREAAAKRRMAFLQSLTPNRERQAGAALRAAGFQFLARLVYLERVVRPVPPRPFTAADLQWIVYQPREEALFCEALESTYVGSRDCPELSGLRTSAEVLASHRAAGLFDPGYWWVALRGTRPVGIVLVSPLPDVSTFEIVYIGVAHTARGTGVGDALLQRAVELALRAGANRLALAVDERNDVAFRLYRRWGFQSVMRRDAWLANLRETET